jgi:hypothetical protein
MKNALSQSTRPYELATELLLNTNMELAQRQMIAPIMTTVKSVVPSCRRRFMNEIFMALF